MNRDTRDLVSILVDYTDGVALPVVIQSQFAGHQMDNAAREGKLLFSVRRERHLPGARDGLRIGLL
jgi:hypothetical protein